MSRLLTAARAAVRPGCEAEFEAVLAARGRAADAAGRRFWVFRSRDGGEYLVFTEWADGSADAPSPEEAELDARLRRLADFAPDADRIWQETKLR